MFLVVSVSPNRSRRTFVLNPLIFQLDSDGKTTENKLFACETSARFSSMKIDGQSRGQSRPCIFVFIYFFCFHRKTARRVFFFGISRQSSHYFSCTGPIFRAREFTVPVVIDAVDTAPRSHYYYSQQGRGSVKGAVVTCIIRTVERFGLH